MLRPRLKGDQYLISRHNFHSIILSSKQEANGKAVMFQFAEEKVVLTANTFKSLHQLRMFFQYFGEIVFYACSASFR